MTMSITITSPVVPEGIRVTKEFPYGCITPDERIELRDTIAALNEDEAIFTEILPIINLVLDQADEADREGRQILMSRIHIAIAELLNPTAKLHYANSTAGEARDWIKGQNN